MTDTVASPAPRFAMRGVRKAFGSTTALAGVDLAVQAGEVCALVGQNGAGKSTLMGVLSGAITPDAGEMAIDDRPFRPADPHDARQAGVAMIYQHLSLAPHLSVAENVALGLETTHWGFVRRAEMRARAAKALASLGHADIPPDTLVQSLSPAAQQLVEIARAVASDCRVLVLDEPTSSLGHRDVQHLFELIGRLREQGLAIVYISHFIEEVKAVADRVVVLRDGRVAGGGVAGELSAATIVSLMVGRDVDHLYPSSRRRQGDALLELSGVMPGEATFTLHRGEILGIAGLVGAGRTRLLRTIFGLAAVRSGTIRVGHFTGAAGPATRWAQSMGMVSEDRAEEGLALSLSIADNVTLSKLPGFGPAGTVLPGRIHAAAARWIDHLGIRCRGPFDRVSALSGGNQQKVALARLLHHDVDLWLLDEPTRGIDVASKSQIYAILDRLVSETGPDDDLELNSVRTASTPPKAVLVVSSYLPELLGLCDLIAVMSRGRLRPPRPASEWTEHSLMMAASGAEVA
jgi:ribose transport system ATP-binding protein